MLLAIMTQNSRLIKKSAAQTEYDKLTQEELNYIYRVVQKETGSFDKLYRKTVAAIIYNRLKSDKFPDSVYSVLFSKGQFYSYQDLMSQPIAVDDITKQAVQEVFSNPHDEAFNIIKDAVYYCNFGYSKQSWKDKTFVGSYEAEYLINIKQGYSNPQKTDFFK